jgi:DNA primase
MKTRFTDEWIEEVRSASDLIDVIGETVPLKKAGANYKGCCPFHHEKTPSFMVSPEKGIYKCFGCGEGGDVIAFVMKTQNMNFVEALEYLANRVNIEIPEQSDEIDPDQQLKKRLYELNREAAIYFYRNLKNARKAYAYFRKRSLSIETIQKFGLGYSSDEWQVLKEAMLGKGYTEAEMLEAGLLSKSEKKGRTYDRFRGRMMFPIQDLRGRMIGFGGRVLDQGEPKYLNSPETKIFNKRFNLYALHLAKKDARHEGLILVEGYMDVIALHQVGITTAVASLGTALTKEQAHLIKRYTDQVYICYDSDSAGQKATERAIQVLLDAQLEPRIILLGTAKDPDEWIQRDGVESFQQAIKTASYYVDFQLARIRSKFTVKDDEQRVLCIRELTQYLKGLKDRTTREIYAEHLARDFQVPKGLFLGRSENVPRENQRERPREKIRENPIKPLTHREPLVLKNNSRSLFQEFLMMIHDQPELFGKLKIPPMVVAFIGSGFEEYVSELFPFLSEGNVHDKEAISNYFKERFEKEREMLYNSRTEFSGEVSLKVLTDYMKKIHLQYYRGLKKDREGLLQSIPLRDDEMRKMIILEIQEIMRKMNDLGTM